MKFFLVSVGLVYAAFAASTLLLTPLLHARVGSLLMFMLTALAIPVACSWMGAEVARMIRPVRMLVSRPAPALCRIAAGCMAGIFGCLLTIGAIVYLNEAYFTRSDWWFTGPSAAIAAFLVVLPWPRVRRGRCGHCNYDLAALTPACKGLCPECGTDLMQPA